ncbi:DUF1269 domain-containing protein [Streptomyces sp. R44]|uniref:DUF1269 domain-containing protein n=1 Tax=Streptomyces sp. R44 TaxID=3238633 RepID=A0AB39TDR4_9ACTN
MGHTCCRAPYGELLEAGALSGTFWGMLFGLLFFMPLLGAAVGAAAGALGGKMDDVGIDDDFIDSVKAKVTQDAVVERVREAFPGGHTELIHSNLDSEKESKLREVFAS